MITPQQYNHFRDVATKKLRSITGTYDTTSRLRHCDSHLSIEDIVSMAMEKIFVLNPDVVTDPYVRITVKTVYLDEVKRKRRLQYTDTQSNSNDSDEGPYTPIEETLVGDVYDHVDDLRSQLNVTLDCECRDVLELYLSDHSYTEIASVMGTKRSTIENYVNIIREKISVL